MAADMEKSPVTELHVRMDCNGCVQRIKKALHSIDGVYDVYVDLPQQKLKVVGRTDPERLVKAIKKTKKRATICSYTDPGASEPPPPPPQLPPPPSTEPEVSSSPPATDAAAHPASGTPPPAEATPPTAPPKDGPPQENQAPEEPKPSPQKIQGPPSAAESKDVDKVHMVHNNPHGHVIREHWNNYPPPMGQQIHHEAPCHVTHRYNTYRPSPYVSEYAYVRSPPRDMIYQSVESDGEVYYQNRGSEGYYQNRGSDGNQITSIFSDENPNACTIV